MTSDTLSMLRYRFPLGATPHKASGMASLGASNLKLTHPTLVEGLTIEKTQVLDRTKALLGPRTQAYGETNYLKEKIQVLDRTKALYGPRTQAYGKTNYLNKKNK